RTLLTAGLRSRLGLPGGVQSTLTRGERAWLNPHRSVLGLCSYRGSLLATLSLRSRAPAAAHVGPRPAASRGGGARHIFNCRTRDQLPSPGVYVGNAGLSPAQITK